MRGLVLAALISALVGACSEGAQSARPQPPQPGPGSEPPVDRGTPVSETEARVRLLDLFRGAGLRIVEDVSLELGEHALTVDGFDPARGIGFEYEDPREVQTQLSPDVRRAVESHADYRILLLPPSSLDYIDERARSFLGGLEAP